MSVQFALPDSTNIDFVKEVVAMQGATAIVMSIIENNESWYLQGDADSGLNDKAIEGSIQKIKASLMK